jgi:hypothetical protein
MYGNTNSWWTGEGTFTAGAISAAATVVTDFSVPGVRKDTDMVIGAMFVNEADLAPTSTAYPVVRGYISADGTVAVAVSAVANTITVASNAKVRFSIIRNDNNFQTDGL